MVYCIVTCMCFHVCTRMQVDLCTATIDRLKPNTACKCYSKTGSCTRASRVGGRGRTVQAPCSPEPHRKHRREGCLQQGFELPHHALKRLRLALQAVNHTLLRNVGPGTLEQLSLSLSRATSAHPTSVSSTIQSQTRYWKALLTCSQSATHPP